jgi:hypothetical protein
MKEEIRSDPLLSSRSAALRRISWQAIFGGLIMVLAVQLLLTVLGISIGATAINPMKQQNPGEEIGMVTAISWIVISVISLFVGGWVAGRLSGLGRSSEGAMHGLVTWGAATLLTVYLLSSTVGGILGGVGKLLSQVLPAADQIMASSPEAQGGMGLTMNNSMNGGLNSIRQEAQGMAQKNAPTPTGRTTETETGQNQTSKQLIAALDRMFSHGENINPNDREAVVTILVTQDNMNRADANQTVDRWIQTYQQSKTQLNQSARQAGQAASQGISMAGWWCFIALALGMIAAALGGSRGALAFLRARADVVVTA